MTELKLFEVILHMRRYSIDILCIQETWVKESCVYQQDGFMIVLSGSESVERSWAGVGFIIAPWCVRRVKCYRQVSDRMASLRVKIVGGTLGLISRYAPHNAKLLAQRLQFYTELDQTLQKCSSNKGKIICGDLNARIGNARPGEHDIFGPRGLVGKQLTKSKGRIGTFFSNFV